MTIFYGDFNNEADIEEAYKLLGDKMTDFKPLDNLTGTQFTIDESHTVHVAPDSFADLVLYQEYVQDMLES